MGPVFAVSSVGVEVRDLASCERGGLPPENASGGACHPEVVVQFHHVVEVGRSLVDVGLAASPDLVLSRLVSWNSARYSVSKELRRSDTKTMNRQQIPQRIIADSSERNRMAGYVQKSPQPKGIWNLSEKTWRQVISKAEIASRLVSREMDFVIMVVGEGRRKEKRVC